MVFEKKHHMPWTHEAYDAYEAYEPNFRKDVVNGFRLLFLPPSALTPSTAAAVEGVRKRWKA